MVYDLSAPNSPNFVCYLPPMDGDVSPDIIGIPLNGANETAVIVDSDGGAMDGDTVVVAVKSATPNGNVKRCLETRADRRACVRTTIQCPLDRFPTPVIVRQPVDGSVTPGRKRLVPAHTAIRQPLGRHSARQLLDAAKRLVGDRRRDLVGAGDLEEPIDGVARDE